MYVPKNVLSSLVKVFFVDKEKQKLIKNVLFHQCLMRMRGNRVHGSTERGYSFIKFGTDCNATSFVV